MKPLTSLFMERRKAAWQKGARYAALIARGLHFLPIFLLVFIYYGYRAFLEWLPSDFPVYLILTVLFTWVLSQTQIRTYVKAADPVFLLPADQSLQMYFKKSLLYSMGMQSLKILFWLGFVFPLFYTHIGDGKAFLLALAVLLPLKAWNVWIHWLELRNKDGYTLHQILRWGSNGLVCLWLFSGSLFSWPLIVALGWLGWLTSYHHRFTAPASIIPWDRLLLSEEQIISRYYRLASHFVDVPHIKNERKKRPIFAPILHSVRYGRENTYLYLYLRTFFRYREPFGVYIRLTLVTTLLLATFQPEWWLFMMILSIAMYITGIQLPWIRRIHRFQPWFRLYPLPDEKKRTGWARLAFILLGVQASLVVLLQWWLWKDPFPFLPILLLFGWLVAWFLGQVHLPKKLHQKSSIIH